MRFLSNFRCKIIVMRSVRQQDSNSLLTWSRDLLVQVGYYFIPLSLGAKNEFG